MGRTERRNVCLSTNRCQGGSREAAAALNVAPRSGSSGVCESQDPPPSPPRLSRPRGRRAPVASRPPMLFSLGQVRCPRSATSGTHFPEGPGGEFCIPGIMCSRHWLRGQLARVFKCRNDGIPSHFFSSLQDPEFPQFHGKHHPHPSGPLSWRQYFMTVGFESNHPKCQMLKLSTG